MNATLTTGERRSIATALREGRPELANALLRTGVEEAKRDLAVDLLADEMIEHFASGIESAKPADYLDWLEAMAQRYAGYPHAGALLMDGPRILGSHPLAKAFAPAFLDDIVEPLSAASYTVIAKHQRAVPLFVQEPLDEIDAFINDLLTRMDRLDYLTAEHSRAVATWCTRLARKMNMNESDVRLAGRSGLLHDLGKMRVPLSVLQAPRRLDDEEWSLMKSHTLEGVAMLADMPQLEAVVPAVRNHHERFDGGGYPDGLTGEDIPLMARVVTVADCFNAMIGRRPYRPPMPPSLALEELVAHRGTQFDPAIVDAMVAVLSI